MHGSTLLKKSKEEARRRVMSNGMISCASALLFRCGMFCGMFCGIFCDIFCGRFESRKRHLWLQYTFLYSLGEQ